MASNRKGNRTKSKSTPVDADFRIKIEKAIETFVQSSHSLYEFPASLTNVERAFVHNLAPKYNLKTRSSGKGEEIFRISKYFLIQQFLADESRRLSLFKLSENNEFTNSRVSINLDRSTYDNLKQFKTEFPHLDRSEMISNQARKPKHSKPLVLSKPPCVPLPSNADPRILQNRQSLPIFTIREQILEAIDKHRIVLIQGSVRSSSNHLTFIDNRISF